MANKGIVIFGAGGHGKVVLDILLESKRKVVGFIDDNKAKKGKIINGYSILGGWDCLKGNKNIEIALGIGDNKVREELFNRAKKEGFPVTRAIHPRAIVSKTAKIGQGVVIMAGAVINPSVIIEDGVVINTGATVDHDCYLKKFCHIWPGANLAGTVIVGKYSYVGTGAAVIQNITIGDNTIIGAGAVVISDVSSGVTAVGVPSKTIKGEKRR